MRGLKIGDRVVFNDTARAQRLWHFGGTEGTVIAYERQRNCVRVLWDGRVGRGTVYNVCFLNRV